MNEPKNLCFGCMKTKNDNNEICPHCGFDNNQKQSPKYLAIGTKLQGRYLIGRFVDSNGEGIGYLGYDSSDNTTVYIREFMPENLCSRADDKVSIDVHTGSKIAFEESKLNYLNYNRALANFRDLSGIVPVFDIFEANETAYVVSEWIDTITLTEFIERSGGRIDWNTARPLFMPVLSSLSELSRSNINHFAISPENLVILRNGKMKLIGFSIPQIRQVDTDLIPQIFESFSALEQYIGSETLNEKTDIYGFTASLFYALTGIIPQNIQKRKVDGKLLIPTKILKTISPHIITALANGLQVYEQDRTSGFERLRAELSAAPTVTMVIDEIEASQDNTRKNENNMYDDHKKTKKNKVLIILLIVLLLCVTTLGILLFNNQNNNTGTTSSEVSSNISKTSSLDENTVDLPNLVGVNFNQAQQNAQYKNLYQVKLSSEEFSDTVDEGCIISQIPAYSQGTTIRKNSVIAVVVSKGPSSRKLPDIAGLSLQEASSKLTSQGFVPQKGSEDYSDTYSEGKVIGYEDYEAGQSLKFGSTVSIVVSKGKKS